MKNNSNCHDSLSYSKTKQRTVSFTIDTIQGVNCHGPKLHNRGNDANNVHPSPSKNTKNQSSDSHDSGNTAMPAQRGNVMMEIIWKPGSLTLLNVETIWNSKIWEQSDHQLTAQELGGIGNTTAALTRLGGNITRGYHNKAASGEYRIPKQPNKP